MANMTHAYAAAVADLIRSECGRCWVTTIPASWWPWFEAEMSLRQAEFLAVPDAEGVAFTVLSNWELTDFPGDVHCLGPRKAAAVMAGLLDTNGTRVLACERWAGLLAEGEAAGCFRVPGRSPAPRVQQD
jgi:hypothetical protein